MDLRDLYQDIILDHGRHPRNFHSLPQPSHVMHGHNPLCGDRVTIYLDLRDGRIVDISFQGHGCAISTASASLMTEVLKGKKLPEADLLYRAFHARMIGQEPPLLLQPLDEDNDRLLPLAGVRAYPARVKCATLAWHALDAAVKGGAVGTTIKTE